MAEEKAVPTTPLSEAAAASVAASAAASAMAKRRLALLGPKGRRELAAHAGRSAWARMSPKARSLEMRRRYALGRKRRAQAAMARAMGERRAMRAEKAKKAALKG